MPSNYLHAETKAASTKLSQNMMNLNGTQKGQSRGGVSSAYHREDWRDRDDEFPVTSGHLQKVVATKITSMRRIT